MKEFENSPLYVRPENKAKDIHLNWLNNLNFSK